MDDRKRERGRQGEKGVAMTSQPKSVNVAKCCGKLKGREREVERERGQDSLPAMWHAINGTIQ